MAEIADIVEFRTATLSLSNKSIAMVVEAHLEERWETISIPVYRDEPVVRTLPTVKRIVAKVRRRYQKESILRSALDGSAGELSFNDGEEVIRFVNARVVAWRLTGKVGGEMIEEVEFSIETEG